MQKRRQEENGYYSPLDGFVPFSTEKVEAMNKKKEIYHIKMSLKMKKEKLQRK